METDRTPQKAGKSKGGDETETESEDDDDSESGSEFETDEESGSEVETEGDEESESESEAASSTSVSSKDKPKAPAAGKTKPVLPKFIVKQKAVLRSGFEMTSKPAGGKPLTIGSEVQALETKINEKGVLRVRIKEGWVSEKAGDGTVLLQKVGAASEDTEEESEEDSEAETDMSELTEDESGSEFETDDDEDSSKSAKKSAKTKVNKQVYNASNGYCVVLFS